MENIKIKVLDLVKSPETFSDNSKIFILSDFTKIGRYTFRITQGRGNTFDLYVGCQGITITKEVLESLLDEIAERSEAVTHTFITLNGKTPTMNSPIFSEESEKYYISKSLKVYDKNEYSLITKEVTPKPKYFTRDVRGRLCFKLYPLLSDEQETIMFVLNRMKEFYESNS